jgi:hypothetical protein
MNSHTDSFIPPEDRLALVQESIAQGVEVFSEGRLTLYAAPWEYAFIAKLARLTSLANSPRVYDMPDAIENLRQYFAREGVTFVPRSEVDRWNARFELELEGAIYERFNQEYSNRFPDSPTPITMND